MKKECVIFIVLICAIYLLPANSLKAQGIEIQWNTFLGCGNEDYGRSIVLDGSGNSYVIGYSNATWGSPILPYSGGYDACVAGLDISGNLIWNTFLGSGSNDYGFDIALDSSGNIYVIGYSNNTWGSPVNAYSGSADPFVACLDSSGNLLWNTFLGSTNVDYGYGIALDSSGNIYIVGYGSASWGSPILPYSLNSDTFVAGLDSSGSLLWNTFLGSNSFETGSGIALGSSGNIYVIGLSQATWGSPVNAYSGGSDSFVAGLDSSGNLLWNTFLGSAGEDRGSNIVLDISGNIGVTGKSNASWGSPVQAYKGNDDGFVAYLDNSGNLVWNTFLGTAGEDNGSGIAMDSSGNIYVTGDSDATWGSPVHAHSGNSDAMVACLDNSGNLIWNTFLGSANSDYSFGIALGSSGDICVTGQSYGSWGSPVNAYTASSDAFIARISVKPSPDITANGSDGPITISQSDTLQIRVSLISYGLTDNADFWLAYKTSSGWYHYNKTTKSWDPGLGVTHQGALFDLGNKKVFQSSGLTPDTYTFYFGVDLNMNGTITKSSLYYDEVKVTVTSD